MKIAFFEIEDWEKEYLKKRFKGHKLQFFDEDLNEDTVKQVSEVDVVCVFIYSAITKSILKKLPSLKAVVTRSTGFDHIDVSFCTEQNIKVLNIPSYGENTVAEHAFALLLSLARKIPESNERTTMGNFSNEGLIGFDLKGKTIGIIGLGRIGKHVAKIAHGFGMDVLAFSKHKDLAFARKFKVTYTTLNNVLKKSDVVTLHSPYNKKTHHLINQKNIGLLKKEAFLINTARGGLIETKALVKALATNQIRAAGLDVLEEENIIKEELQFLSKNFPKKDLENLIENHMLLTLKNVIITPHNAFNSHEALHRIIETTAEDILGLIKNPKKKQQNQIN